MPFDTSKAPVSASPLWIIALFIALSEVTTGVAASVTNGASRLIFTCFAVTFPSVVFGVFIWLLIKHAPNLYSPGQYSRDITPEIYRAGISRSESAALGRAVAETVVPLTEEGGEQDRKAAIDQAVRRFETALEESSVVVDLNPLLPGAAPVHVTATEDTSVQWLLDTIFFELDDSVDPSTYGVSWIMVDDDGKEYSDMGRHWAQTQKLPTDPRSIAEVGIFPGSHLTAIPIRKQRRSRRVLLPIG
jgi:hypothetical protein